MFKQEETEIYVYHNGEKVAWVDPIEIQIALEEFSPDWRQLFSAIQLNDIEATKEVIRLSRLMFSLPDPHYDEAEQKVVGLTSQGAMNVLLDYVLWSENLKKSIDPMQTSLPPSESQDLSVTNVSTESGSTSTVP